MAGRQNDRYPFHPKGSWALVAIGVGLFFLVFVALIIRHAPPEGKTWFEALFGTAGILPALLGFLTLAGAGITIWYLARRDRHDDRQFRVTVMKESAGLMASDSDTAKVSGLYMMASLSARYPDEIAPVGLRTITSFLIEASSSDWNAARDIIDGGKVAPPIETRSKVPVVEAMAIVGELRTHMGKWPDVPGYSSDRLRIGHVYVGSVELAGRNYQNCDFIDLIGQTLTFTGCDFTGATMKVITTTTVTFKGCTLRNFKLEAFRFDKEKIGVDTPVGHLIFDKCLSTDGARLHGTIEIPSSGKF